MQLYDFDGCNHYFFLPLIHLIMTPSLVIFFDTACAFSQFHLLIFYLCCFLICVEVCSSPLAVLTHCSKRWIKLITKLIDKSSIFLWSVNCHWLKSVFLCSCQIKFSRLSTGSESLSSMYMNLVWLVVSFGMDPPHLWILFALRTRITLNSFNYAVCKKPLSSSSSISIQFNSHDLVSITTSYAYWSRFWQYPGFTFTRWDY